MKFNDYYKHYLSLHQNKWCRRLHMLGQLATIVYICLIGYLSFAATAYYLPLFLLTPTIVYPFAWMGHFIFEKNSPAAFRNPWLAKLSDARMTFDILRGRIPF